MKDGSTAAEKMLHNKRATYMMQMVVEKTRDRQQWREFFQPQRRKTFGCMMDGTASKLTDLSYTNFIILCYLIERHWTDSVFVQTSSCLKENGGRT